MLWIILIIKLIIPGSLLGSKVPIQWNPVETLSRKISVSQNTDILVNTMDSIKIIQMPWDNFFEYFSKIWLLGFILSASIIILHYIKFNKELKDFLIPANDKITEKLNHSYSLPVPIRIIKRNTTPFAAGILREMIVLPQSIVQMDNHRDMDYIIQHEMAHIKKKDTLVKMLFLVARCIHWFNPLVYLMGKMLTMDLETACDEVVTETLNKNGKIEYCNVLYKHCTMETSYLSLYGTTFSSAGIRMKERFDCILTHNKKYGRGIIFIACLLAIFTSVFIKAESSQEFSKIVGTKLSYTGEGDIMIISEQLTKPIILKKTDEGSIIFGCTDNNSIDINFKSILNSKNLTNELDKKDIDLLRDLRITVNKTN